MNHLNNIFFRAIRHLIAAERKSAFTFVPSVRYAFPKMPDRMDFYVHIPYCRSHCRWCPYNTRLHNEKEFPLFFKNLLSEAHHVASTGVSLLDKSLYIGGGTPTSTDFFLLDFIKCLSEDLGRPSTIAVETSVDELTHNKIRGLKSVGVSQLSIGVQSFNAERLKSFGRASHMKSATDVLGDVVREGFDNVNIDIMCDVQQNTLDELGDDISRAVDVGVDQITIYPLFQFFTERGVVMPRIIKRKRFYNYVWKTMCAKGYVPSSVWSFCRPHTTSKFSSVQRRTFVGLGPGAATSLDDLFVFNTFDYNAWQQRISNGKPAYSLEMPMSVNMRALYDLYWDIYELHLPKVVSKELNSNHMLNLVSFLSRILGFCDGESLTKRGAFWMHLLQNQYILNYINKVWSASLQTPFPTAIRL
jgi:oxygen-independent coproporphyrinogen-3 oxidase